MITHKNEVNNNEVVQVSASQMSCLFVSSGCPEAPKKIKESIVLGIVKTLWLI